MTIDNLVMRSLKEIAEKYSNGRVNNVLVKYLEIEELIKREFVGRDEDWYKRFALARTRVYFESQ
ncbi:MAG: hypothetical protein KatS3mg001_499 [Candidatus Pacearchaeota archaeon]|nr:MAG: hypothetical protein KatS3mg001_499 [Candidatus Pacearchaeota archaeon]